MSLRRIRGSIVWLLLTLALAYLFFYGSGFTLPFLSGCGLAILFYLLRSRDRVCYGMIELLAGTALVGNAIYSGTGRGSFSPDFSADFARFDARLLLLQSYGGLFIMIRGLDNIGEGCTRYRQLIGTVCHKIWP